MAEALTTWGLYVMWTFSFDKSTLAMIMLTAIWLIASFLFFGIWYVMYHETPPKL
jgi:hypothetical protein